MKPGKDQLSAKLQLCRSSSIYSCSIKIIAATFLAIIFSQLSLIDSVASAQQGETGMVRVQVMDKDGKSLPGATVTLLNEAGEPVTEPKLTNELGELELVALPIGKYRLRVEEPEHQMFDQSGIEVLAKTVTSVSLQLNQKISISDVVTVQAESDNLVEQQSAPQGQFTLRELKTVPLISSEFDQALPIVPNVIRGTDGRLSIKGARENQSGLLINEADATDPATGNYALSIPLESIEQVQVFTNPYLPQYGKFTGGVTKIETRRGGDKWKFEVNDLFPEPRIRNGRLFGFTNVSPRVHIDGPIVKNRFFLSQGLEFIIDKKPVRGLRAPDNEIKKTQVRSFSQFDLLVSTRETLTFTLNLSGGRYKHIGLDFFNPKSVAPNQRLTDGSISITDRRILSDGSLLEAIFQFKRIDSRIFSEGDAPMAITPVGRSGNYFHREQRVTKRYELHVADTIAPMVFAGTHNFKLGVDVNYLSNEGESKNRSVNIPRVDGRVVQRIDYITSGDLDVFNTQISAFAQDQWLIGTRANLDYGIRLEAQRATAGVSVMPRVAFSYSPTNSGATVLRAAFGLFYDKVPLNSLNFVNQPRQLVTTFAPDGKTIVDGPRPFVNLLAPRPNGKPNSGLDFAAPRNTTFSAELNRRLTKRSLLKIAYLDSRTRNDLYISPIINNGQSSITLFNDGRGEYRSLELTGDFQLRESDRFTISYIRSRARGELNDFNSFYGDFPDPVIRPNQFGELPSDAPNRLLARGTFKLPYKITLSPLLDVHTGFPYSIRDELQNFVGRRNSERFPRFVSLDTAISKDFLVRKKYNAQFTVSIFNVTDHNNPRNVRANIADPAFGEFFARYRRFYRLDFAFAW